MTDKAKRHAALRDLIQAAAIGRQEDLVRALLEQGIAVTQSTLSKDIRELGIAKVPDPRGGFRYQVPPLGGDDEAQGLFAEEALQREIADFVLDVDGAGHTLVLKTTTGHAQGVCEAVDRALWPEVVGTLAGENTIFVLCRTEAEREAVAERVERLRAGVRGD